MRHCRRWRRRDIVVGCVGVSARGGISHVGIAVVFGERVRSFKPRLAIEAEKAHSWPALSSGRGGRCAFSIGFVVVVCHRRVWRLSPWSSEQGQAAYCYRRGRWPVTQRAEVRQLVGEKSCVVGVKFRGLCWRKARGAWLALW